MNEFWPILDIEYVDAYPWIIVPPRSGPTAPWEEWDDIAAWSRERAEDLWLDRELEPGPNGIDFVAGGFERYATSLCPPGTDHWLFLHVDHPTDLPLPVCATIGRAEGDREETLRALTFADDPEAVEPPVVKTVTSAHLGSGISAFRYARQEDSPNLMASIRYAWRVEEHEADVVMWTATEDVALLLSAAEDVEVLAQSLAIFIP